MRKMVVYFNTISLRFRWIFMSPRAKYMYLWGKTQKVSNRSSAVGYPALIADR
jgi:hypothetical protein